MPSFKTLQPPTGSIHIIDGDPLDKAGAPTVPATGEIVAAHAQFGPFCQTTLRLNNVPQAVVNGTEHQGTKIYDFPAGRIAVMGVTATLQQKTTSVLASTLNASSVGAISLGTVTSSSTTLSSTMANLLPSTAFTSSATINVAGTAVSNALAAEAQFDGTTTPVDVFLNTAYATTTDVDGNATQTISGTVVITWINLGDY
jgi:hypothetical protein